MNSKLNQIVITTTAFLIGVLPASGENSHSLDINSNQIVNWVGHINPDTDSIGSSIGAAYLYGGIATRSGALNQESQFVLEHFNIQAPLLVNDFSGKKVALVDFNQKTQLPPSIQMKNISAIVDHHALREASVNITQPIRIDIRPWGSTASIISSDIQATGKTAPAGIAGVLMSAILSDTLLLTSPTTTQHDIDMVEWLAKTAKVDDVQRYGMKMLEAKSNLDELSTKDIVEGDFKRYQINGKAVGFGVAETLTPDKLLMRKKDLLKTMVRSKKDGDFDLFFFAIVDVLNKNSYLLLLSDRERDTATRAFDLQTVNEVLLLANKVSRKRQFIPAIKSALTVNHH